MNTKQMASDLLHTLCSLLISKCSFLSRRPSVKRYSDDQAFASCLCKINKMDWAITPKLSTFGMHVLINITLFDLFSSASVV